MVGGSRLLPLDRGKKDECQYVMKTSEGSRGTESDLMEDICKGTRERRDINSQTVDSMTDQTVNKTPSVRARVVTSRARTMATMMMMVAMPKTPTSPSFCFLVIWTV